MELTPRQEAVAKARERRRGKGMQAKIQNLVNQNPDKSLDELADQLTRNSKMFSKPGAKKPPLPPDVAEVTQSSKPPPAPKAAPKAKSSGIGLKGKAALGAGALAAGGAGAYLYKRRRVEKSLSSMQRDEAYMMMRSI